MKNREPNPPEIEMAIRLRRVCEAHDPTIAPHLERVAHTSVRLARLLGFPKERIRQIYHAAPLHDIGKIGLRRTLLQKPGNLNAREMTTIQSHTQIGHEILGGSLWPTLQCAASIAWCHHENWDGSGYPNGLRGVTIPLEARIVAIADVYDALLSVRPYKAAWSEEEVIAEMKRLRSVKYEPGLIDLFLENLPEICTPAA